MNIQDAAHRIGHEYPGGATALAHRMGIGPAVFNSKLNPNTTTHHLGLVEAHRMQQLTGRVDILQAMADDLGYSIIKLPDFAVSDAAILESYTAMLAELGEFSGAFNQSLADNRINKKEFEHMRDEMNQAIAAALSLIGRIEQLVE